MKFTNHYLSEIIDYGGEPYTRAEAIADMQKRGIDQPCIDRWLQGYEHAQRIHERNHRISQALSPPADSTRTTNRKGTPSGVPKTSRTEGPTALPKAGA